MFNQAHMRRRFDQSASRFDSADFLHAATREGLLERMRPLLVDATTVLDLGAATGSATRALEKRFRKSQVVSLDSSREMLEIARSKRSWLSKSAPVRARAEQLPFADQSFDVVFSNQLLPCIDNLDAVFSEVARVLKKGGVFAFATLGPDSLQELRHAWHGIDASPHVNEFPDMHNIGDGLVNAGLVDPVVDVDQLTVSYEHCDRLFDDLTAVGARNSLANRSNHLASGALLGRMTEALRRHTVDGRFSLSFELVYGHCWGAGPKTDPTNVRIDAGSIPIRRR